jgi:hypothetical protein
VVILTQVGAWFAMNVPHAQKLFWTHPMVLLGDEAQLEARFSLFRDRCMVCAKCTTTSKIVLDAPDGTPR